MDEKTQELLNAAREALGSLTDHVDGDAAREGVEKIDVCPCQGSTIPRLRNAIKAFN